MENDQAAKQAFIDAGNCRRPGRWRFRHAQLQLPGRPTVNPYLLVGAQPL